MIEINVAQLLKSPIGTERNYEIDGEVNIAGEETEVTGKVNMIRTQLGLLVRGRLETGVKLECVRCLNDYPCRLSLKFEEEYLPVQDVNTGVRLPPPEDKTAFKVNEQNILDLSEAIRQYTLTAIPMKPLCRQDCAGICPVCGKNRNIEPCGCEVTPAPVNRIKINKAALTRKSASSKKRGT